MDPASGPASHGESALQRCAQAHGFVLLGFSGVDLHEAEPGLAAWLDAGHHGSMAYMERHGMRRARPAELVPGTVSVLVVAMPYRPDDPDWLDQAWTTLADPGQAYVSRYALGRDYHKVVRSRLAALVADLQARCRTPLQARVFCDSAPVMEVELARRAGLGWRGKHTLLLNRQQGSLFFLGAVYLNRHPGEWMADLPPDPVHAPRPSPHPTQSASTPTSTSALASAPVPAPDGAHCGSCRRCIDVCPTQAIVAPYRLDARRCISYLTIENDGPIDSEFREAMGNRIYGCDDCQLVCPWNSRARPAGIEDFRARHALDQSSLLSLFAWSETEFEQRLAGSAIRRIGHRRWQRNLAVALGNALRHHRRQAADRLATDAPAHPATALHAHDETDGERDPAAVARDIEAALKAFANPDPMLREHVAWALAQR